MGTRCTFGGQAHQRSRRADENKDIIHPLGVAAQVVPRFSFPHSPVARRAFVLMKILPSTLLSARRNGTSGRRNVDQLLKLIGIVLVFVLLSSFAFHLFMKAEGREDNYVWFDGFYWTMVTMTTLGYGEIVPTGLLRTICGFEALIGLLMMAWSAAFTVFRLTDRWRAGLG